jgi:hypothetical protein
VKVARECIDPEKLLNVLFEESAPFGSGLLVAIDGSTELLTGFMLGRAG